MRTPDARCKVCKSSHLIEYERWHYKEKLSSRKLSALALEKFKEKIGKSTFDTHFKHHSQVPEEVQRQYEDRQNQIKEVAGEVVDEIAILDQLIKDELETHNLLQIWAQKLFECDRWTQAEELPKIPMAFVHIAGKNVEELRQLIKTKSDLLNGDLKGAEAQMVQAALKKANEHKMRRLNGSGTPPDPKPGSGGSV